MSDIILGAKIQIDTGGSAQAITSTVKGINDMGSAAKAAQAQFAALSKQAQQSSQSFAGIGAALGMNKAAEIAKNALEAQKAMGMLGAAALAGNKAIAASTGSSSNIMAALTGNLKAVGVEMEKTAAKSEKASNRMAQANEKVGWSIRGWLPHIRTASAAFGVFYGVRAIQGIGQAADAFTNMGARLRLVVDDANQLAQAQSRLYQISQSNQSGLEETTRLYTRMALGMKDLGRSQSDSLAVVDLVTKGMKISGASSIEAASGLMQFSQALQAGVLNGDEFRSMMENMPRVAKAIADGMGLSMGQLRKLSEAQQLTADKAINALMSQSSALNTEASKIPITIGRAWTELGNAFMKLVADADRAIGASNAVARAFEGLSHVIERFTNTETPLEKTRKRIKEIGQEIGELNKQLAMPWWQRPLDVSITGPGRLDELKKELSGQQNRLGGLEAQVQPDAGPTLSRTAKEYINAANAAWKLNAAQKAVVETIVKIGEAQGFDPAFLLSIAKAETQLGNIKQLSNKGAQGIFQFMPGTAKNYGVKDPFNLEQATNGAIKYLGKLKAEFKSVNLAAAGYNAGEGAVRKYGNNVPPYKETQTYVRRVMENMRDLQAAMGKSTDEIGQDLAKAEKDQFSTYQSGLQQREKAYDDYSKVALAKSKTLLDELAAQQQAVNDRATSAIAMGDSAGLKGAEEEAKQLILARNQATLESIAIEEKASQKRLGNIGMEIAAAQKLNQFNEVAKLQTERNSVRSDLGVLAETRKQLEIQTNNDILKSARDFAEKRLQLDKGVAEANVAMAQERRQAAEGELAFLQKQEEFRQQIGEQAAQGAKAAIDSQLQQQQAAMAGRKAERDAQLENLTGLAQIKQARQNINADLQDQLGLIEAEKQAAQAKLAIDQQMLGYQEQMLQAQLATTSERERRLEIESAIAQIHLQQADNLRAVQNAATQANAAAAKAQSEAAKGMGGLDVKEVKERQLRENAFWDQLIGRAQEYANIWNQIGENSNDAFSAMFVASNKFIKNIDQISKAYKEMAADAGGGSFALDMAEGMAQAQNALNMVAQSLILVRNQYEKGTDEYKKYDQAAAGVAVAAKVAAVAEGILAVVHQMSSGDPYSAIPRALAVAAMLASMGIQTGASGGGTGNRVTRQETQGSGTVLGDTSAQSESIANSLRLIQENTSNDLSYSAGMLRALEDLNVSILALANSVAVDVMPAIATAINSSGMQFGMTKISLFSGFNKQLTDSGLGWFEQSLEKILSSGFSAKMFADITRSFEVLNMTLSESTQTYVRDAGSTVNAQITRIFRDIVKSFQEGAKAFGLAGEDVMNALKGFKIGMEQVSLQDMSMEEQQQALGAVFSKITDKMAKRLNNRLDLGLEPFQKAGQGLAETFFMVAEGINRANGELERLNVNAINYKDILNKQGDPAAEIVRQSLAAQTQLSQSVRDYVNVLTGSAEDIIEAYKQIISASNLLKTAGIGDANLSQAMTNAAGGLSEFVSAMEAFNENFLSEADRYAGDVRVLSEQFGALGYALPDSKEAFAAMVRGIDTSTEAGQKLFGQMIALSESFAKVANEAQAIRDKYASILDPFKAISDQIQQVGTDFGKLLGGVVGDSQGRINSIGNAANQQRGTLTARQSELQKEIDSRLTPLFNLYSYADKVQADLDAELAKKPKNQNAKKIKRLQEALNQAKLDIQGIIGMNQVALDEIASINLKIANIDAQEGIDKAAESARLALEKQGIIDDARLAMGKTLEDIFTGLAQTIQQAQQRLQSVLDLQKSLASQIAQLQGPQAVFGLASTDRNNAFGAIDTYINSLADGRARDVGVEVGLLNTAQQAVMAKYNAEIAAIQEAEREYIAAETERLNTALQLQIEAINDALDAQIKAQSKLDAAAQKAMQKQFDAEQKAMQKAHDAQLKALGDELDAANKLRDAIKGIQDYVRGMALGGNSPLSPEQRLAEAQRQYQDLLARAQGGDADAMQKLSGASDAYLEASKQYYGSGTQYANTFDAVKNAMSAIGGMSAPDPDSIQSRIDALREAQADEMDRLRELQAEKLDALREKQQEAIEAMRQSAQKQIEAAQKATQQAIADLSDPNKNAAMRAAREAAERDLGKLAELAELTRIEAAKQAEEAKQKAQEQAEAALKMAQDQLDALQAGTRLSAQQLGVLSGILQGMGLQPIPIEGYAKGGYAKAGLALVGEQGPEIVRFERPAQVMTADETRDALRGGNDGKIVQAIAELKAEMRAVVVTQSNANPQIIAELSEMKNRLAKMERTQRFTVGA